MLMSEVRSAEKLLETSCEQSRMMSKCGVGRGLGLGTRKLVDKGRWTGLKERRVGDDNGCD